MTREGEIKQYCSDQGFPFGACSSISSLKADIATEAIKWADKTMIDKVCKWIEDNVENAFISRKGGFMVELAGVELSEDLRKLMEE